MSLPLANLFPDGIFKHQMGFQRGEIAAFFSHTENHHDLVSQRRHWLNSEPHKYAALLPEGAALLDETTALAIVHHTLLPDESSAVLNASCSSWQKCLALASAWEPDFLLLRSDENKRFRLVGGSVCFPSSWSLEEKIGHPLEAIHAPVPDLNQQLGSQIHTFLWRLRPGAAWLRTNWGLSASPELNQHPSRGLPKIKPQFDPAHVWLRVEHQSLVALPRTGGVLFGIRINLHPLSEIKEDVATREKLLRALESMPEKIAEYKRLAEARAQLINWLK